jgi:dephospho-CoA kinase
MDEKRYIIGLTGNIATGKSVVLQMLKRLGAFCIDADELVHYLMRKGTPLWRAVLEEFGEGILSADGEIDRKRLGDIVFKDTASLRRLEEIVHPTVIVKIDELIRSSDKGVVAVEAIKLIESGMYRKCDSLWVVTCRKEQQLARLMAQKKMSEEEALLRIESQSPQEEKVALADVVINNSGDLKETWQQVKVEWNKILKSLENLRGGGSDVIS